MARHLLGRYGGPVHLTYYPRGDLRRRQQTSSGNREPVRAVSHSHANQHCLSSHSINCHGNGSPNGSSGQARCHEHSDCRPHGSKRLAAIPQELQYVNSIADQTNTIGNSFEDFSSLAQNPQLLDQTWRFSVAIQLGIWQGIYSRALDQDVPVRFQRAHVLYLDALQEYDAASRTIAKALDNLDASSLAQGANTIKLGNQKLTLATQEFERLRQE